MVLLPNIEQKIPYLENTLYSYFKVNINKCKHDENKQMYITITNKIVAELNSHLSLNVPDSAFLLFYSIAYIKF